MISFLAFFTFLLLATKCFAQTLSTGEDVASFVNSQISSKGVMVFSKSYCPYCKRAKGLLLELQKSFEVDLGVVELDILPGDDGRMIQTQLLELTGQRTVPNIFIGQKYVGGNSDLQQLHESRKLKSLLLDLLGGAPEL